MPDRLTPRCQTLAAIVCIGARTGDDPGETMNNAQRSLVGNLESQMQLIWADDLRRSAEQEARLKPFVERNVAALEHGADRGAKLPAAAATEFQSGARTLSGNRTDPIGSAATCAYRSVWPDNFFELGMRRLLIPKIGPRDDGHDVPRFTEGRMPKAIQQISD